MKVNIEYRPSFALAIVGLAANEAVVAEAGAMVSMSSNVGIQTSARQKAGGGGVLKALKRSVLGGESFFMNTYTATVDEDGALNTGCGQHEEVKKTDSEKEGE